MKIIIGTFITLLFAWLIIGSPFIFGDGYGYFHAAKALATNNSFYGSTKPEYYNYTAHAVVEIEDKYITPYPIGNTLIWYPALKVANIVDTGNIYTDYYKAFNGHSLIDGIIVSVSALLCASFSIFLIYKSLLILKFSKKVSYFAATTTLISTFGLAYILINASYSHIYEIFIFSWIIYLILKIRASLERKDIVSKKNLLLLGFLFGLLFLMRPFDILLIVPIAIYLLKTLKFNSLWVIPGGIPLLGLFMIYNQASYGSFFTTGYSLSDGFIFAFNIDRLIQLLFSDIRGCYVYSPLVFLSTIGLFILNKQIKGIKLITIVPVISLILGYSFWQNWWAGDSAGQRFLLVLVPLMSIGTAAILQRFRRRMNFILTIVLALTIYSLTIFVLYRFTPTNKIGESRNDYTYINSYERFGVSDILKYHLNLINSSVNGSDYLNSLQKGLTGGRSMAMIYLNFTKPILKIKQTESLFEIFLIPTPTKHNNPGKVILEFNSIEGKKTYSILIPSTTNLMKYSVRCTNECFLEEGDLKELSNENQNNLSQYKVFQLNEGNLTISVSDELKLSLPIRE